LIGKKLVSGTPYAPAQIVERQRIQGRWRSSPNQTFTDIYNQLVDSPLDITRVTGVDFINPEEPRARLFRYASSFYLGERFDDDKLREFDELEDLNPPNVKWSKGHIEEYTVDDYKAATGFDDGPTAVYAPFSLYELETDPADQRAALKNAVEAVHDNGRHGGIVGVLDDVRSIDPDFTIHISHKRNRTIDYPTTSFWVYDSEQPKLGFQRYMHLESGRCHKGTFEPALTRQLARVGLLSA
jgi:hypothetical protein